MASLWLKSLLFVLTISYVCSTKFISNKIQNYEIKKNCQEDNSGSNSDYGAKPNMSPCTAEELNEQKQICLEECLPRYPPEHMGDFCFLHCYREAKEQGLY